MLILMNLMTEPVWVGEIDESKLMIMMILVVLFFNEMVSQVRDGVDGDDRMR